jgi:ADP-heptose:LPS heptosyltransferase
MVRSDLFLPKVKKIVVLRANALGDFIVVLPALQALRETYPKAEIVLLGKQMHYDFLKNRPGPIDRVIVLPTITGVSTDEKGKTDEKELEKILQRLRKERFDLAVQLHGGGRYSNPFMLSLNARVTIGLKTEDAAPLDRWVPYVYYQPEVFRFLEVVALVGAKAKNIQPHLDLKKEDLKEIDSILPKTTRPIVVIHPGATDPRRRWPVDKFAIVAEGLAARGAIIVLTGTKSEKKLADNIIEEMSSPVINLVGKLSINGLVGLLFRSSLLVSNDTGPLHLAMALVKKTVGIYWCGNLINAGPMTRANNRCLVSWMLRCPICGVDATKADNGVNERKCRHKVSFVSEVPEGLVYQNALDLLENDFPEIRI